jgi:hypothetical protein
MRETKRVYHKLKVAEDSCKAQHLCFGLADFCKPRQGASYDIALVASDCIQLLHLHQQLYTLCYTQYANDKLREAVFRPEYNMIGEMWNIRISTPLEILCKHMPDYYAMLLDFTDEAGTILQELCGLVPAYSDIWYEYLGKIVLFRLDYKREERRRSANWD